MSSLRSFTVFQDTPSAEVAIPKVSRPKAMTLRSSRVNGVEDGSAAGGEVAAILNKENLDPLTGDRVGAATGAVKKRKALAAKPVASLAAASKGKKSVVVPEQKKRKALTTASSKTPSTTPSEPEPKKRKALSTMSTKTISAATNTSKVVKPKKETKGSTSTASKKRAIAKKVAPMPPVNEEDEADKDKVAQAEIDSRVYDLTVKPLADVSEAYEAADVFGGVSANTRPKFGTVKAASVEPEMRDYCFPPKEVIRRTSVARFRAASEGIPDNQPAFSTPERKKIYAAFTFSSPPRQANGDFL